MSNKRLKIGLIGGGGGKAFIVNPHRKAIAMNEDMFIGCAALHQDPATALADAENWSYPITGYATYDEMIEREAELGEGRMDYVLIVTPNNVHFDPAMKCIEAGFPVFCEKPLTDKLETAEKLAARVRELKIPFAVAHTYLGHWTSLFSRWIITSGRLGNVRKVIAVYWQGWLAGRTEDTGLQQAVWRVDPSQAGSSCCGGDIGTHAFMQARFVTGLEIVKVISSAMPTFVKGRKLDDDFTTKCELSNGGYADILASQIMHGHKNDLRLRVICENGSLSWRQEDSECVKISLPDGTERLYWRGAIPKMDSVLGDVPEWLRSEWTIPAGHNEGFHDAFSRLHRWFAGDVRNWQENIISEPLYAGNKYAGIHDGLMHMRFIDAAMDCYDIGKPVDINLD